MHKPISPVLQQYAVVVHAAQSGSVEALRPEAVASCVRDLCAEIERLALRVVHDERVANDTGAWVRIAVQAEVRGFTNSDSFRRWCRRRKVPLKRVGKVLFVRAADIDRTIEAASRIAGERPDDAVRDAVDQLKARRR